MAKIRYKYNPKTLQYEKIELTIKERLKQFAGYLLSSVFLGVAFLVAAYTFIDSPKEAALKREIKELLRNYEILNRRFNQVEVVLGDLQNRDDNIYRVIFEAEPIPESVRKAGIGGVNRYRDLESSDYSEILIETAKRLDKIEKQLYIQSKSFDDVIELVKTKEEKLASIPAIQPVSNSDLKRMASGFGFRIHPIYKTRIFHSGMDFTAPTGTDIYATGNGTVTHVEFSNRGYGNHVVVKHGFGYETLYAHMSKIFVKPGQKVNRGEVIGLVGNTGTSTAPHLHYEVRKNGNPVNPINFYFNDLTPEQYQEMIYLSSQVNQTFD
ncbi:MAG: peptidoglycan DD-metalloendopeptidase family protein [Luteibaculaceae bacterium]